MDGRIDAQKALYLFEFDFGSNDQVYMVQGENSCSTYPPRAGLDSRGLNPNELLLTTFSLLAWIEPRLVVSGLAWCPTFTWGVGPFGLLLPSPACSPPMCTCTDRPTVHGPTMPRLGAGLLLTSLIFNGLGTRSRQKNDGMRKYARKSFPHTYWISCRV